MNFFFFVVVVVTCITCIVREYILLYKMFKPVQSSIWKAPLGKQIDRKRIFYLPVCRSESDDLLYSLQVLIDLIIQGRPLQAD